MKLFRYDSTQEEWGEFISERDAGRTVQIDEEMFMYWLEVLPPVYMHKEILIEGRPVFCSFGFAEGREPITDFWKENGKLFCKRSDRMSERG